MCEWLSSGSAARVAGKPPRGVGDDAPPWRTTTNGRRPSSLPAPPSQARVSSAGLPRAAREPRAGTPSSASSWRSSTRPWSRSGPGSVRRARRGSASTTPPTRNGDARSPAISGTTSSVSWRTPRSRSSRSSSRKTRAAFARSCCRSTARWWTSSRGPCGWRSRAPAPSSPCWSITLRCSSASSRGRSRRGWRNTSITGRRVWHRSTTTCRRISTACGAGQVVRDRSERRGRQEWNR